MRGIAIDRPAVALIGLLLMAAGGGVIEWRYDLFGLWSRLDTGPILDILDTRWFAWVAAAVAVVLALLALGWLLSRIPRPTRGKVALGAGSGPDRIEVDARSIAPRLRRALERAAPVDHVTSRRTVTGGGQLVQLRAHIDPRADGESLLNAARGLGEAVAESFPDGEIAARVLVNEPRRPSARKTPRVH